MRRYDVRTHKVTMHKYNAYKQHVIFKHSASRSPRPARARRGRLLRRFVLRKLGVGLRASVLYVFLEFVFDRVVVRDGPLHFFLSKHQALHRGRRDDIRGSPFANPPLPREARRERGLERVHRRVVALALRDAAGECCFPHGDVPRNHRRSDSRATLPASAVALQQLGRDAHLPNKLAGFARRHLHRLPRVGVAYHDVHLSFLN
mmetsp:Transcript_13721/g.51325  ORF Transcript_13721/g.51325 Transcript_13721/m.51325 type:complete len:204 (-) Transcript_13721:1234-1845(-)